MPITFVVYDLTHTWDQRPDRCDQNRHL